MPASASSAHQPEDLIDRLRSYSPGTKLKALRELKNKIIGNPTKKLYYLKLGAVPIVVSILYSAVAASASDDAYIESLLLQSTAAIGSFACRLDAGVKAVLDSGAFPHLLTLIEHHNDKVVDAGARSLRMIYLSKLAPKYDFLEGKNTESLLRLLNSENENVTGLGASIISHSCKNQTEQNALSDSGILKKLIYLLGGSVNQRDASLESISTIIKDNLQAISKFVGPDCGRALSTVIELTKDRCARTRLYACICLIIIENLTPSNLQGIGIRTKLILILLELLDDPGQVGHESAFALSNLIAEKEDLQKIAFESNAVVKLIDQLQKDSVHAKRYEGVLLSLANLCSNLECCRSKVLSLKALNLITGVLTHHTAEVRAAACICLKSVSRSVKNLSAGLFVNESVIIPLVNLLDDDSTSVQVAALGAISNVVVDFKTHKSLFIRSGGVKHLIQFSKSMDSTLRLNAVWALKNLSFLVDTACKEGIFTELTVSTLASLICDPKPCIQEQAMGLVRNLVDGPLSTDDHFEYIFAEDFILLQAVARQLQTALKTEILIQGMYFFCNVASGNEVHKDAVMYQLLPRTENTATESVLAKFLQTDIDNRLRIATVWTLVNLTFPSMPGAFDRIMKLKHAGIYVMLKSIINDPCLDVKLRVRMALGQSIAIGDGTLCE
jgi:hypothetical protein